MSLYEQSIKKSYVDNNWSVDNNNLLNKLNKSSSTSYKKLDNNDSDKSDNSDNDINYTIKTKNQQNALKAYILSSEIFKSTFCQSLVKANNLDNDNNYLLDNNKDCYKISFS